MTPRPYLRSGFYSTLPLAPDSPVAQVLRERRDALIADLGGRENCSTAQLALVDLVVASWAQLDSVTDYLLSLPSLVDKRHRRVWQVVRDRATLASQLQSLLRDIGLDRRAREVHLDILGALAEDAARTSAGRCGKIRLVASPFEGAPLVPPPPRSRRLLRISHATGSHREGHLEDGHRPLEARSRRLRARGPGRS